MALITIRPARPDEASRLTQVAHAAKRHWGYDEHLIAMWAEDLTVAPEFVDSHPVYCAVEVGDPVGFYALSHEDSVFELEHMWVVPSRIGAGIGRLLFAHALEVIRNRQGELLRIASDPNAEEFYIAMGARRVGVVDSMPEGRQLPLLELRI